MTTVRDYVPHALVSPAREQMYGIEVEFENFRQPPQERAAWQWSFTDDGSLRNAGVEFLSPGAWNLETCEQQIRLLWEEATYRRYQGSIRTGIHVHVNMLDYTLEQLGGVLMTYCLLEPVLFRLCGPEREECIYCVPWYRAGGEEQYAYRAMEGDFRAVNNACKYSALYLEPLRRFGTIEFRHAPTYDSAEEFINWLKVLDALVAYGKERTARQVFDHFEELGADDWGDEVFGPLAAVVHDHCEDTFENIIDNVDSVSIAEGLLEYEEHDGGWTAPTLYVQGNGTDDYHRLATSRRSNDEFGIAPSYALPEDDWDEPYYEEDY